MFTCSGSCIISTQVLNSSCRLGKSNAQLLLHSSFDRTHAAVMEWTMEVQLTGAFGETSAASCTWTEFPFFLNYVALNEGTDQLKHAGHQSSM